MRRGRRVEVNLTYAVEKEPLPHTYASVGIDMGISDRMTLSSGQVIMPGGDTAFGLPGAGLEPV